MPRIRTVKPEFFTHPEVVRVSIPARLLFLSLLTQADDEGRLYDQPRKIAAMAFGDNDRVKLTSLMSELLVEDRLCQYETDGKRCIHVRNFRAHQAISKPSPSRIPPCPIHDDSRKSPGRLPEDSSREVEQGTGNREVEQGKEEELETTTSPQAARSVNGKSPFAIDDHQQGLLVALWEQRPEWIQGRGSLTYAGLVSLMKKYGPGPVNDALEELLDQVDNVDAPHPWLDATAADFADPTSDAYRASSSTSSTAQGG